MVNVDPLQHSVWFISCTTLLFKALEIGSAETVRFRLCLCYFHPNEFELINHLRWRRENRTSIKWEYMESQTCIGSDSWEKQASKAKWVTRNGEYLNRYSIEPLSIATQITSNDKYSSCSFHDENEFRRDKPLLYIQYLFHPQWQNWTSFYIKTKKLYLSMYHHNLRWSFHGYILYRTHRLPSHHALTECFTSTSILNLIKYQ